MPTGADEDEAKIRRLPWVLLSAALGSVYGNLGSGFLLYYDEMGMPKTYNGLLNALIFLPGPLALFVAPLVACWGFKRTYLAFYSTRKLDFCSVGILSFCPAPGWNRRRHGVYDSCDGNVWRSSGNRRDRSLCVVL